MNYLAHIHLASQSDEAMIGALLGDFAGADYAGDYTPEIEREIAIHRKVDSYTDSHPVVLAAKEMFEPGRRRFAGILLDMFYDHVLIVNWERYSAQSVDELIARFYRALEARKAMLPERLQRMLPYMIGQDWLGSYREFAGVELAAARVSQRLSRNGDLLIAGLEDLRKNYDGLSAEFHEFFPELTGFAGKLREQMMQGCRLP
ncbi:MAG TPA: ACP phosphodiesterase [Burkholderiaceae bacterium]